MHIHDHMITVRHRHPWVAASWTLSLLCTQAWLLLISCTGSSSGMAQHAQLQPPAFRLLGKPHPQGYVAHRAAGALDIDGRLDKPAWASAPWSEDFVDITGEEGLRPWHQTRVKMLWDDMYLYIGAELEEPHPWATLTLHDSIIYKDNDFEIFIDPDGDNHMYMEIEINAHGTVWDLLLARPYRNGGPAIHSWESIAPSERTEQNPPTGWAPIKRAVHVNGILNDGSTTSKSWSVEVAIPWNLLAHVANRRSPPLPGDQWRLNFSRVQWKAEWDAEQKAYHKVPADQAEQNWVWSTQYQVAMHQPETWGYVQFDSRTADQASSPTGDAAEFMPDPSWPLRAMLMDIHNAQTDYWKAHGTYADTLEALGLVDPGPDVGTNIKVQCTDVSFIASGNVLMPGKGCARHYVNEQGRLTFAFPQDGAPLDPSDGNSKCDFAGTPPAT